jgi:hypothetical protein
MSLDDFSHADQWGPEKIVTVADTRTGMRGVLVIDNTARGMGKGGTRMSPALTITEVVRLARVMTWKWAGGRPVLRRRQGRDPLRPGLGGQGSGVAQLRAVTVH